MVIVINLKSYEKSKNKVIAIVVIVLVLITLGVSYALWFMKYLSISRDTGSWYNNECWFINNGSPWLGLGGLYNLGTGAGIFHFNGADGNSSNGHSFRLVLAF